MADNKNQHYVPQFYLRNFSSDDKNIAAYHLGQERSLGLVPIKDQCSKDYFYQSLDVEKQLCAIEADTSEIISKIIAGKYSKLSQGELLSIRAFIMLQNSRTKHSADLIRNAASKMKALLLSMKPTEELKKQISEIDETMRGSVDLMMNIFPEMFLQSLDLSMKLLINQTDRPFITSDDPVFEYDQYLERVCDSLSYGIGSKGIEIFMPISAKLMLLLYDSKIYKIGTRKSCQVMITQRNDVDHLNLLTVLYSDRVIYYEDGTISESEISQLAQKAKRFAFSEEMEIERYDCVEEPGEMLHAHPRNKNCKAHFSFIKELDGAKAIRIKPGQSIGSDVTIRDYSLQLDKVRRNEYRPKRSLSFVKKDSTL